MVKAQVQVTIYDNEGNVVDVVWRKLISFNWGRGVYRRKLYGVQYLSHKYEIHGNGTIGYFVLSPFMTETKTKEVYEKLGMPWGKGFEIDIRDESPYIRPLLNSSMSNVKQA